MKELLERISSYNLFNYLLPGIVFAVLAQNMTSYVFIQADIVVGVFVYYFIGMVISRVGSVILEPIFKKLSLITFAPYEDFVSASKKDAKLEVLSEVNNMYRTFCSLLVLLALLKIYEILAAQISLLTVLFPYLLMGTLFALFVSAYVKQTQYIKKRVEAEKKEGN